VRRRLGLADPEEGVYAILYAILAVVLIGMAAIVVDFASVRQDRRLDRAAADNAALGGARLLDYSNLANVNPQQACLSAWDYLSNTLHISTPSGACGNFAGVVGSSCWSGGITTMISDDRTVNGRTYRIAWPVPANADNGFLTPDLAPGNVSQPPNTATTPGSGNTDGYTNGCDKLGVAVFLNKSFGLGGALGYSGTSTQVHSVAKVVPNAGPPGNAAALNVLADDCETLTAKGGGSGGFVFVGPVLKDDGVTVDGPGVIAVESSARNCNGGNTAIDVTGGNVICASRSAVTATTCTGDGVILDHAMDAGMNNTAAYTGNAAQLRPTPIPEQGVEGYIPVTKHYGCNALPACQPPTPNFISQLVTAYGGSGKPSGAYTAGQSPYPSQVGQTFTDVSSLLCPGGSGITGVVPIPAGYNYASCTVKIASAGVVIVAGGTLVINGGIQNSGCFVMNAALSTCPTAADLDFIGTPRVTTKIRPPADAQVFIRGNSCPAGKCFDNQGTLVFPQTFVYNKASSEPLNQAGTNLTLWTAPDAGAVDGSSRTTLDNLCKDSTTGVVSQTCVDSRFGRLTYWSEAALPTNNPNVFVGQGNLNVVGVFFTPLAAFKFGGGSGYASAAAQFWSAYLTVGGGAQLGLSPIEKFSLPPLGPHLALIR
jgi:hypothetical protein